MAINWKEAERRLTISSGLLNKTGRFTQTGELGPLHVGVDLGTADVVVMVLKESGEPVAAFLEWAEVVRDGVVVDFIGAADIVCRLMDKARKRLGADLTTAATAFPPGTDSKLSNILERAGLNVTAVQDEPSCVAKLLQLDRTAVVDIGDRKSVV